MKIDDRGREKEKNKESQVLRRASAFLSGRNRDILSLYQLKKQRTLRERQSDLHGDLSKRTANGKRRGRGLRDEVLLAALAPRQSVARAQLQRKVACARGSYANLCPRGTRLSASPKIALFSFHFVFPSNTFSFRRFFFTHTHIYTSHTTRPSHSVVYSLNLWNFHVSLYCEIV